MNQWLSVPFNKLSKYLFFMLFLVALGVLIFLFLDLRFIVHQTASVRKELATTQSELTWKNPFQNSLRAKRFRGQYENDVNPAVNFQRYLLELLRAGRYREAINRIKRKLENTKFKNTETKDLKTENRGLKRLLAVGYFLEGACFDLRSPDACVLPVEGRPEASRKAAGLFKTLYRNQPSLIQARYYYNLAMMATGKYPDKVPNDLLVPGLNTKDSGTLFKKRTHNQTVERMSRAGDVIVEDFDKDGSLDLLVSSFPLNSQLKFYKNTGNGTFRDRTPSSNLSGLTGGLTLSKTDYNNDGLVDFYVPRGTLFPENGRLPDSLLKNEGNGEFTEVTREANLHSKAPTSTSSWSDVNRDGYLDLYRGFSGRKRRNTSQLLLNRGDGTFKPVRNSGGIFSDERVRGSAWRDIDHDGDPDLFLSLDQSKNKLYLNQLSETGEVKFRSAGDSWGVSAPRQSFSAWFFDYNNDGWSDLFVGGHDPAKSGEVIGAMLNSFQESQRPKNVTNGYLYRNQDGRGFDRVSSTGKFPKIGRTMGANFGDFDADGFQDLYLGTGRPSLLSYVPNRFLKNMSGTSFDDQTLKQNLGTIAKGHGVGVGDLNNDGYQDLYAVLGGVYEGDRTKNRLMINSARDNNWISLKLVGRSANRPAVGARVTVVVKKRNQKKRSIHRVVSSGGSFGDSSYRLEIGLGKVREIEKVKVIWPDKRQSKLVLDSLQMKHHYTIRQKGKVLERGF